MTTAGPTVEVPCGSPLWRTGGLLAMVHVVLMVTGILVQSTPSLSEGEAGILRYYVRGDVSRILTGGYIELLGFVVLLPVVVLLSTELGRHTEAGRWASYSAGAFGIGYVAMTVGSGLAPGAAALWGSHHGLDPATALIVNDVRNFAFFLGLALLGGHTLGVALAAVADGWATRTVGWGGVATGAVLLCSVPFAGAGLADAATLVWIVWWVVLAVTMMRRKPSTVRGVEEPLPAAAQR